ncbi:MAG TPA: DUF4440 domain-containing protein [Flavipsychrobacter sp.]|nr:DUF4440 domain-containing protein [Flavipsychrobacter sp.]
MKYLLLFITCFAIINTGYGQNKDEQAIRSLLSRQVNEWNNGNIAGYMKGYWENDSLLFIGQKGPRYGYQNTLARYQQAYPDTAHMGKLTSVITSMKKLASDYYFIVGTWALKRSIGDLSGYYTLLFRKINGQWVIVVDHSS